MHTVLVVCGEGETVKLSEEEGRQLRNLHCLKTADEKLAQRFIEASEGVGEALSKRPSASDRPQKIRITWSGRPDDVTAALSWLKMGFLPVDADAVARLLDLANGLEMKNLAQYCKEELPWLSARTFDVLLDLNRKFLKGEIKRTPYHCGPLDEETLPLVPKLLEMADAGLMSHGSQPFEKSTTQMATDHPDARCRGQWTEAQQIPFVDFLLAEDHGCKVKAVALFDALRAMPDIVVRATRVRTFEHFAQSDSPMIVSRVRTAATRQGLEIKGWKNLTGALADYDMREEDFHELRALKETDVVDFSVAAAKWEDIDVLQIVLDAAASASGSCGTVTVENHDEGV